ncbi:U6 snRNA-associated Sm-like protein LSm8 [Enterocytozoon bieneusi H348]|nr:U6 snRNA-associated Sm-like protein LSm8 [Enterocytozoon bieneusi H348]|eukprot:XP_001827858.1 U6 snRNA-associated Sm-like protein LSm8 [Enterocytozoon bieneusi H348]
MIKNEENTNNKLLINNDKHTAIQTIENNTSNLASIDLMEYSSYVDKNVVVILKDNSLLYGTLKSYDQYNNISLNYAVQRIFHNNQYAEKMIGFIVIRGDTIVMISLARYDLSGLEKTEFFKLKEELEIYLLSKSNN